MNNKNVFNEIVKMDAFNSFKDPHRLHANYMQIERNEFLGLFKINCKFQCPKGSCPFTFPRILTNRNKWILGSNLTIWVSIVYMTNYVYHYFWLIAISLY